MELRIVVCSLTGCTTIFLHEFARYQIVRSDTLFISSISLKFPYLPLRIQKIFTFAAFVLTLPSSTATNSERLELWVTLHLASRRTEHTQDSTLSL